MLLSTVTPNSIYGILMLHKHQHPLESSPLMRDDQNRPRGGRNCAQVGGVRGSRMSVHVAKFPTGFLRPYTQVVLRST
jgi:hypothetical protein